MLCWWVVGVLALFQAVGLAGRARGRRRRGVHRARDAGTMRAWPGDRPDRDRGDRDGGERERGDR